MEDRRNKLEGVFLLIAFLLFEYTFFFFRLFIVVVVNSRGGDCGVSKSQRPEVG